MAGNRLNLLAVCLCFVLSGVAALVYQIAWARMFALIFGTSELAIAAVLAAYMGGLALGAWLIERRIRHVRRPVLCYAGLELGIAAAAVLLIPAGLWLAERLLVISFGGQLAPPGASFGATSLFCLAAAFAVLLVPTSLMGATLPLLARHAVQSEQQIGRRIGVLYACNTGGAVGGALLGSLFLLPEFGLTRTTWVAAAINLLVALLALLLSRSATNRALDSQFVAHDTPLRPPEQLRAGPSPLWVLPLMLLSGAVSFLHEVLWTRMLGHVLGSSIHAFGVMLASFLAGIALGGGLGAVLARSREAAVHWLAISELAAGLAAIAAWIAIQHLDPSAHSQAQHVAIGIALLFPLAFAIGLTYPLAVRILARSVDAAAAASARVYGWNTVGAILGASAGGFLIVPALRYEGAVQLAVGASCALACAACFALLRTGRRFSISVTVAAVATIALFVPAPPDALLRYSPLRVTGKGELLYYDVGRSAAVVALRLGDQISLRTNGLTDAVIDMRGTSPQLYAEAWMAPLAVLARPQLQELLVVGLGGGRVLEAVPPSVRHIDVIELEDKVIDANQSLAGHRSQDPLRDSRVAVIVNDARGALQLTRKKYDAIISQPSHPWTAGASHLYTREFMQQAKAHLNPAGLFVQWMNVDFLDEPLLRSLLATLNSVYPHVRMYRPAPPTLLFLASDAPIEPERSLAATRAVLAAAPAHYGRLALNAPEDLLVSLAMDTQGSREFAADAAIITDDANRFAVSSVFDSGRNLGVEKLGELLAPYDPLLQARTYSAREAGEQPAFDYVARRIHAFVPFDASAGARMGRLADLFPDSDLQAYIRSLAASVDSREHDAHSALANAVQKYPDSALLRDALLEGRLAANGYGGTLEPGEHVVLRAARLAGRQDWSGVAMRDSELAQIAWTSLWNAAAVRLRIEWRAHSQDAASRPRLHAESLELIDRLNVFQPVPRLYLLRALSAGDSRHILLESLFRFALLILQGQVVMDDDTRREFTALQQRFTQLHFEAPVDQHHHSEVRAAMEAAAARL